MIGSKWNWWKGQIHEEHAHPLHTNIPGTCAYRRRREGDPKLMWKCSNAVSLARRCPPSRTMLRLAPGAPTTAAKGPTLPAGTSAIHGTCCSCLTKHCKNLCFLSKGQNKIRNRNFVSMFASDTKKMSYIKVFLSIKAQNVVQMYCYCTQSIILKCTLRVHCRHIAGCTLKNCTDNSLWLVYSAWKNLRLNLLAFWAKKLSQMLTPRPKKWAAAAWDQPSFSCRLKDGNMWIPQRHKASCDP